MERVQWILKSFQWLSTQLFFCVSQLSGGFNSKILLALNQKLRISPPPPPPRHDASNIQHRQRKWGWHQHITSGYIRASLFLAVFSLLLCSGLTGGLYDMSLFYFIWYSLFLMLLLMWAFMISIVWSFTPLVSVVMHWKYFLIDRNTQSEVRGFILG